MRHFIITCIFGGGVYTLGGILSPQETGGGIFLYPIVGALFTAVVISVLLLPLRAAARTVFPRATPRAHGIAVFAAITVLLWTFAMFLTKSRNLDNPLELFGFWWFYALVIIVCWFWPAKESTPDRYPEQ